jgi:hypothetical protein
MITNPFCLRNGLKKRKQLCGTRYSLWIISCGQPRGNRGVLRCFGGKSEFGLSAAAYSFYDSFFDPGGNTIGLEGKSNVLILVSFRNPSAGPMVKRCAEGSLYKIEKFGVLWWVALKTPPARLAVIYFTRHPSFVNHIKTRACFCFKQYVWTAQKATFCVEQSINPMMEKDLFISKWVVWIVENGC